MAKFLYVYHSNGAPTPSEDEMEAAMAAWGAWFGELGGAVIDGGNPIDEARTVSASGVVDGGGANPAGGYSLIEAADMDAAVAMSKGCPMVAAGGSVEVCATIAM